MTQERDKKNMPLYQTKAAYFASFEAQFDQLTDLLEGLSGDTYWQRIPYILGIDAKLVLLTEVICLETFSSTELIRMIEQDYRTYYKELCGYNLRLEPQSSLIFSIC